jgi:hypothetical protein
MDIFQSIIIAIVEGLIEFVYPDKPNHPRQKYRRMKN